MEHRFLLFLLMGLLVGGGLLRGTKAQGSNVEDRAPSPPEAAPPDSVAWESAFRIFGDARIRFENTSALSGGLSRTRQVMRLRVGAEYLLHDWVNVGLRFATGSADDPNSTDVTLSDFNDDLAVGLDRAFLEFDAGDVSLTAGKFENPFVSTDLVWDGDVNPQGVTGTVALPRVAGLRPSLAGVFFLIDEQADGPNSHMGGGQVRVRSTEAEQWAVEAGVGYYDYEIGSLDAAGPGDVRGNRLGEEGMRYRSDFDLVDLIGRVFFHGWGERWPMQARLHFVRNVGAVDGEDTGIRMGARLGRHQEPGDVRVGYGYTQAETDAVFAAFSHDNTTLSTNYRQHAVRVEYVPIASTGLSLVWYLYRPLEAPFDPTSLTSRVRVNASVFF